MDKPPIRHHGGENCTKGTCLCSVFRYDYTPRDSMKRIEGIALRALLNAEDSVAVAAALEEIRGVLRRYDQRREQL